MYTFLTKYGQLIALAIGVVIIAVFYLTAINGQEAFEMLDKGERYTTTIFNVGLGGAIFLLVVAAAAWLVASVVGVVRNPKSSLRSLIAFGAMVVLFFVLYSMADGDVSAPLYEKFGITSGQSKLISAGLSTTGIMLAGALLAFLGSEIRNFFK